MAWFYLLENAHDKVTLRYKIKLELIVSLRHKSRMKENQLTRQKAASIAKDLVEGGINARYTTKIAAESHGVSIATAREIRRAVLRMGSRMACSMVEAIANGWEDETLGLRS